MPAGFRVNVPAFWSWPHPTPTDPRALCHVIQQSGSSPMGLPYTMAEAALESEGGWNRKDHTLRQKAGSPGADVPRSPALRPGESTPCLQLRRGGRSAEQLEPSDWQLPGARKPAFSFHVSGCDSCPCPQEERWDSNGVPIRPGSPRTDLLLGEMHRPPPTTMPTPGPPAAWPGGPGLPAGRS